MTSVVYSMVVDTNPKYAFQAYHLVRSLRRYSGGLDARIVVQFTPETRPETSRIFRELECEQREIARYGDGTYCNKVGQLQNLTNIDSDYVALLDSDMLAVGALGGLFIGEKIRGRMVGLANPSIAALTEIADLAGMPRLPPLVPTDCIPAQTFAGNFNGGLYVIPRALVNSVDANWRAWTLWVLNHSAPLSREGNINHADQVGMWLALNMAGLPFEMLSSNWNLNPKANHARFDFDAPVRILHYHNALTPAGQISEDGISEVAVEAVRRGNEMLAVGYDNRLFWDLRYAQFPRLGSGIGSRGDAVKLKREVLISEGILSAESVLDVGCGDLEVLRSLELQNYLGIDQSPAAIEIARRARPDWRFLAVDAADPSGQIGLADFVVCLEVLIHQNSLEAFTGLLEFLAAKTRKTLIVSGFEYKRPAGFAPSLFFHAPLQDALARLNVFQKIRPISRHTSVTLFRCDK